MLGMSTTRAQNAQPSPSVSTEAAQMPTTLYAMNAMKTSRYLRDGIEIRNVNVCARGTITIAGPEHAAQPD
ncbi:hypothetical protein DPMN_176661 [Dreissena polymorpha]|uniref:Uncharacterized protein n=1 Tax=Dreissena polymorpha TaxID=45954 RepID=A0A9D4EBF0_DREPO|nr:hypothetical protein DPMN_176661 [Dreissena polymorpha]